MYPGTNTTVTGWTSDYAPLCQVKTDKDPLGAEIAYNNPLVKAAYPAGTLPSKGAMRQHGRPKIVAADPSKTQILGNYRFDYRKNPVQCREFTWADRFFTPGHMQSECDPHLWGEVEDLVNRRIEPAPGIVAEAPKS